MKYRGADGWLHDDGVSGPRHYEDRENVSTPHAAEKKTRPCRGSCPNCRMSATWRVLDGKCSNCNYEEEGDLAYPDDSGKTLVACCASIALALGGVFVGAGVGYWLGGGGGLVAGIGLALVAEVMVICALTFGSSRSKNGQGKAEPRKEA